MCVCERERERQTDRQTDSINYECHHRPAHGVYSFQPADIRYMHHLLSLAATALFWQHVQPVEFVKEIPAVTLVKKFPKFI